MISEVKGGLDYEWNCVMKGKAEVVQVVAVLQRSVAPDLIVTSQREALQTLKCIISNIDYRFYKA